MTKQSKGEGPSEKGGPKKMTFISMTVNHPHIKDLKYDAMINLDSIVLIENTRILTSAKESVYADKPTIDELKNYIRKSGNNVIKLGG